VVSQTPVGVSFTNTSGAEPDTGDVAFELGTSTSCWICCRVRIQVRDQLLIVEWRDPRLGTESYLAVSTSCGKGIDACVLRLPGEPDAHSLSRR